MGAALAKLFIDPEEIPNNGYGMVQCIFLMAAYGYVLFRSSNMISDGSELLLLVPSLAGLVGSVVLPILGAVPDGAIVVFSGLDPDIHKAQAQLSVGVGALAGSTIMLLTIPFILSIYAGRVDLDADGNGNYRRPAGVASKSWRKLSKGRSCGHLVGHTGVNVRESLKAGAKIMIMTLLPYVIIQGPAFYLDCGEKSKEATACHGEKEKWWAFGGFMMCVVGFIGYLAYQVWFSNSEVAQEKIDEARKQAIERGLVSLSGAFATELDSFSRSSGALLPHDHPERMKQLRSVLRSFFNKYDSNHDGGIDRTELVLLLNDLGETMDGEHLEAFMHSLDTDDDGKIDFDEFCTACMKIIRVENAGGELDDVITTRAAVSVDAVRQLSNDPSVNGGAAAAQDGGTEDGGVAGAEDEGSDGEEEEEVPEDLQHLPPHVQQRRIKVRAAWMMGIGTALVVLFSDPMVDVISKTGEIIGGGAAFYVSFILAPLASNASELIAAYNYAGKKTKKTITISFAALVGAACMNNTFCLGIFLALLFFRGGPNGLVWEFSAETISILLVQLVMAYFTHKRVLRMRDGLLVALLYPLSILLVAVLELPAVGLN